MKRKLTLLAAALCTSPAFAATTWATTIDAPTYAGSTGTITFNDWGYVGPAGVGANDFQVGTGFNAASIGQIQHVITQAPDYLTPDPGSNVVGDLTNSPSFTNANMDGGLNFYKWAYITPANSTFSAMKIDTAGNYYIAKQDMSFGYYDMFEYRDTTGVNPNQSFDTRINFKPYTVSDAKGWCGSVLSPNPGGVAQMAGQVTFDFAMDVYFDLGVYGTSYSSTQLVPDFVMSSYGDYTVNVTSAGGDVQAYSGSAVGNNTNPESIMAGVGGTLDPAYQNDVSFLGAGVLPSGVRVSADSFNPDGSRKMRTDVNQTTGETTQVWDVTIVDAGTAGSLWHSNAFAGYAYVLRADGMRILDYVNPAGHSLYVATIPEPETYAMLLAGLGLVGAMAARRRRQMF